MDLFALSRRAGRAGFSLTELIVVLAIAALIFAIAVPIFNTMAHRARVDSAARQVNIELLSARLQAIKRGNNVGMAVSNDASATALYRRVIVFVDQNVNGTLDVDGSGNPTEPLLADELLPPESQDVSLRIDAPDAASPSTTPATTYLVFTPFGSVAAGTGAKAVYLGDTHGNLVQVRVASSSSGKIAMTKKLVSGGTTTYVEQPWHWY